MTLPTKLLLISSSAVYGTGYLDHAEPEIREIMGDARRLIFIPYALADRAKYASKAIARFAGMGLQCKSIDEYANPVTALDEADAIFVGGGNTFRLLKVCMNLGWWTTIPRRVQQGMIYMSASAGSNVACPTIRTTNDMPIVEPPTLRALNLFPWQINPHYMDAEPGLHAYGGDAGTAIAAVSGGESGASDRPARRCNAKCEGSKSLSERYEGCTDIQ